MDNKPAGIEKIQLAAILRVLGCPEDDVASILHIGKTKVVAIERWIKAEYLDTIQAVFDDQALKRVVGRELPTFEEMDGKLLIRAGQVTADDILRHYRADWHPKTKQEALTEAVGKQEPPALSPPLPTFNIGNLKIVPSPIGTKLVSIGPPMFFPKPPLPAYVDISIRLHVENPSDASITISGISYKVTINGNYAGKGSAPGEYTISPHSEPKEIDVPFRADFKTGGSVVISAIISKKVEIGLIGTAHYQSNSYSADKPFSGVISVTLQLPFHLP